MYKKFLSTKLYTKRDSENQRSTLCQSIGGAMDAKQLEKMMWFAPRRVGESRGGIRKR